MKNRKQRQIYIESWRKKEEERERERENQEKVVERDKEGGWAV